VRPTLPLILFSSLGRKEAGDTAGLFSAYLGKPLRQSQLFDTLIGLLGHGEAVRPAQPKPKAAIDAGMAARHPLRILLAEDNVVNEKVATRFLEKLGYVVHAVPNGREAVDAWARGGYDLVLMDCQMPVLDGYAATREIRARENGGPRTPIVALTANAMKKDELECRQAGMDDHLAKPLDREALARCLAQWVTGEEDEARLSSAANG
jgi:CheY-like chemotaxis protein